MVNDPPVVSPVNGPSVLTVPSGAVIFTFMFAGLSLFSMGVARKKLTVTDCPTPIGLGATLMKAYVGILVPGGKVTCPSTETSIESISNVESRIIAAAFLRIFKYFFSPFFCCSCE